MGSRPSWVASFNIAIWTRCAVRLPAGANFKAHCKASISFSDSSIYAEKHMDTPGNAEEIEQGLRLMRVFREIKSATVREQIIAFISECGNQGMVSSPQMVDDDAEAFLQSTNADGQV